MADYYLSSTDVAECITNLVARNKLWANKTVKLYFIVNSKAGCFTNNKISKQYYSLFYKTNQECLQSKQWALSATYKIHLTEYQDHAKELTETVVNEIKFEFNKSTEYLIVTCGGDGTSLEVQTALYNNCIELEKTNPEIPPQLSILRLPLGTGNDGTDGRTIEETFDLLKSGIIYTNSKVLVINSAHNPSEDVIKSSNKFISKYCDVKGKAPWYAFNIGSIGLDAFISFVTNLIKTRFPGNVYKICVPISGLFYSTIFKTGNANIDVYKNLTDETPSGNYNGGIYLTAMGVSGNRTYGGGIKVLSNFNNICVTKKTPVLRLMIENPKFIRGEHVTLDFAAMFAGEKIVINYDKPILLQCDGECSVLSKEHFPITMEKLNTGFKVISRI